MTTGPVPALPLSQSFLNTLHAVTDLTPTEQRLADHLNAHWQDLPLTSAAEVAQDLGVNPSSVTRFAQRLGYRGYPDLQRSTRQDLRARQVAAPLPAESLAAAHWAREVQAFQAMAVLPEDQLDRVADQLVAARRVFVTGARGSAPAAAYAAHLWHAVRPDVHLLTAGTDSPEVWLEAGTADLLVVFTVRRYAQSTARLVARLLARDVPLVLITDSPAAPHARQATLLLVLPVPGQGHAPADWRFVPLALPASLGTLLASKLVGLLGTARLEAAEQELGELDVLSC